MDAIVALYGSGSSDSDSANDNDAEVTQAVLVDNCRLPDTDADAVDDASTRQTRKRRRADDEPLQWKRAFAHVDGNWPSHVKVDIFMTEQVARLVDGVVDRAQQILGDTVALVPMANAIDGDRALHLSLSRPFVLTYDQIELFVDALRAALKWRSSFRVSLDRPIVLVNDGATRSFLALQIGSGAPLTVGLLKCVDKCMREFGLQTYYEHPIPHVSIASALGDLLRGALSQSQLDQLRPEPDVEETSVVVRITSVRVVIGNKHFHIPLR